jgi:hypothetical protein
MNKYVERRASMTTAQKPAPPATKALSSEYVTRSLPKHAMSIMESLIGQGVAVPDALLEGWRLTFHFCEHHLTDQPPFERLISAETIFEQASQAVLLKINERITLAHHLEEKWEGEPHASHDFLGILAHHFRVSSSALTLLDVVGKRQEKQPTKRWEVEVAIDEWGSQPTRRCRLTIEQQRDAWRGSKQYEIVKEVDHP